MFLPEAPQLFWLELMDASSNQSLSPNYDEYLVYSIGCCTRSLCSGTMERVRLLVDLMEKAHGTFALPMDSIVVDQIHLRF